VPNVHHCVLVVIVIVNNNNNNNIIIIIITDIIIIPSSFVLPSVQIVKRRDKFEKINNTPKPWFVFYYLSYFREIVKFLCI